MKCKHKSVNGSEAFKYGCYVNIKSSVFIVIILLLHSPNPWEYRNEFHNFNWKACYYSFHILRRSDVFMIEFWPAMKFLSVYVTVLNIVDEIW